MRGHDQRDVRRRLAIVWLLLVSTLAQPGSGPWTARGQDARIARWQGNPTDSIRFRADQVLTWEEGEAYWVVLDDQAEITQGDVSLRGDRAVARIVRSSDPGNSTSRVDLYIEGQVRDPGRPREAIKEVRTSLMTRQKVGVESRVPNGVHSVRKAPPGLPLLGRAVPQLQAQASEPPIPEKSSTIAASSNLPPLIATTDQRAPDAKSTPSTPLELPFGSDPSGVGSTSPTKSATRDPSVRKAQAVQVPVPGFPDDFSAQPVPDQVPDLPALPQAPNSVPLGPSTAAPEVDAPSTDLAPLPPVVPRLRGDEKNSLSVILPDSQRVTTIYPRSGETAIETAQVAADGTEILTIRNGVNIQTRSKEQGIVDIQADNVVIWRKSEGRSGPALKDFNGQLVDNNKDPLEFYLEGHVVFMQDQLIYQGKSDQRTYQGERVYYDVRRDSLLALNAQLELFAAGLITPIKIKSPRILQYHPMVAGDNGQLFASTLSAMQIEKSVTTGSRFANPGYRFTSRSIDVTQVVDDRELAKKDGAKFDRDDLTWLIDSRQNFFFFGPIPVFYLPRVFAEADNLNPPITGFSFATNNFFGQQFRTDYDAFTLLGRRHLPEIDAWNIDVDYLSGRDKKFGQGLALGTEVGWYGSDLINDINDPYHKKKNAKPSRLTNYVGYFDIYGLFDGSRDVLGGGPAIITDSPNNNAAGRAGFSRISNPFYKDFRGVVTARHMQSFVTKETPLDQDIRLSLEVGVTSDRNFLEQYFKRRFDTGLDQENLAYFIRQNGNTAATVLAETNLQSFNTETQWYPKLDYYRLGDSLLGNRLTYFHHTGVDYANVHTAAEVNNRTIFSYLPTDPISNTKGTFQSGRLYTAHELDLPVNLGFMKVTPYLQGQAVGWNNQIAGHSVGRLWGAAGARADLTLWKAYPNAESEFLNVHGLNHKIDFVADYRNSYSSVPLNSLGVQDDLDDNAYEYSRRYFALTNYVGGVLPGQYDPRNLLVRRALSPITGPTDVQATIETLKLGIHQRLQTKRGPEGRRHINDYMIFDLDTTYFPLASRDNFGKPFGQNFYNYEWYIGDRTSIVSYGWFEFWKLSGSSALAPTSTTQKNDPFGLHIITSGVSITRIPKGNVFIGYTIVNTGPINTSALNAQYSYWLSPKWFGTVGESYDFGNGLLLGATGSLTRIGADYLSSVGLAVSPLQHSYQFVFTISPRLSPNIQFGSAAGGLARLDSRFAPVE